MITGVCLDCLIAVKLKEWLELLPVCVVTGARQTGKSTLHSMTRYSEILPNQIPSDFWVP